MEPTTSESGGALRRAIAVGGLVAGSLDITDAFVYSGLRGASPVRVLRYIASGLLGPDALTAGIPVAALGLLLHFFIATSIVTLYVLVSRKLTLLARHPFLCGPLYGVLAFLVMNRIVVPLSRVPPPSAPMPLVSLINQVAIHAIGIGLTAALAARWLSRRRAPGAADAASLDTPASASVQTSS